MRLSVKIALYMLGVIAFAVVLLTYLSNSKFRSLQEEVERSRFLALALDVKGTAERGLALGLGLDQMSNLGTILARLDEDHPEILSLRIVDAEGEELFAEGPPLEPAATELALRLLQARTPGGERAGDQGLRDVSGEAAFGFMVPLVNAFGQNTGALVLHYDRSTAAAAAREVTLQQVKIAGIALLLGALGALLAAAAYLGSLTRGFSRMARWAERPEGGETAEEVAQASGFERRFLTVYQRVGEVEEMVGRAEGALGKR